MTDETPILRGWEAKRAGGRITLYHSTGKIPGIEAIQTLDGKVIATHHDGRMYILAIE